MTSNHATPKMVLVHSDLSFLYPMNLIRGMVEGKGSVRPVQAFMFLEMFL